MEISEEQRKQAIVNARRAKLGKSKSEPGTPSLFNPANIQTRSHFVVCKCDATFSPFCPGGVSQHQQSLHPLHQRHVTIPTSVPQQQVFALAEPPKRKPYDVLYTFTRNAFFRK